VTDLKPIAPELFAFVFRLATEAMDGTLAPGTIPSMVGKQLTIETPEGDGQVIEFSNHAVIRMMDAVASQVEDPKYRASCAARIYHLYGLMESKSMSPYLREGAGGLEIHEAAITTAATHPADETAGFHSGFFEAVRQLAE